MIARAVACLMDLLGTAAVAGGRVDPEALEKLAQDGVFFAPQIASDRAAASSFKGYLLARDPYADFLTPAEYAHFKEARQEGYAGIGMELERERTGRIRCYPDSGGPAASAGVAAGDELVAIDQHPVRGLGLPTLVALASGPPESRLLIDVATRHGRVRRLAVVRRHVTGPSVSLETVGARMAVRISFFTPNTRQELDFILANRRLPDPLILDLRGNRGGDLNSAIDCAMLFLKPGDTVVTVRSKHDMRPYASSTPSREIPRPVYLWQDAGTASAAEVFIAALTDNREGIAVGTRTFGKGTRQDMAVLRSGYVLIFTTGYLITPGGKEIDGRGLEPDGIVTGKGAATDYLDEVSRLASRVP